MRSTWLGRLFRRDRQAGKAEVVKVLQRCRGNVKRAAFEMGFDRRYVFRILWRESLWHVLDEIRAKYPDKGRVVVDEVEWLARARQALRKEVKRGLQGLQVGVAGEVGTEEDGTDHQGSASGVRFRREGGGASGVQPAQPVPVDTAANASRA